MTKIANDHQLMSKMMTHFMTSNHAMQMMMSDSSMMVRMINGPHMTATMHQMMTMAEEDIAMCRQMTTLMMNQPNMMNMMVEQMHEEGMMDENSMMRGKEILKENQTDHQLHH